MGLGAWRGRGFLLRNQIMKLGIFLLPARPVALLRPRVRPRTPDACKSGAF